MCGIVGIFNSNLSQPELRKLIVKLAKRLRHRGPDWSGVKMVARGAIAHERLAIVDPESGSQPLTADVGDSKIITLAVNGEIYNHAEIAAGLATPFEFQTRSDCECILPLYLEQCSGAGDVDVEALKRALNQLKGMFGFVLHDARDESFVCARDHMGIIPLYIGWGSDGSVRVASELKALADACVRFEAFPPGHFYSSKTNGFVKWYDPAWHRQGNESVPTQNLSLTGLRQALTDSVRRRMMSDVPWGVLLSGGLDSSLVASIATRLLRDKSASSPAEVAQGVGLSGGGSSSSNTWGNKLHSFCIGLEGSPDLAAAKRVADFLGTIHHTYTFTVQEGLDAVSDVIFSLETYDTTTIRAATPMYLMSRKIKALGVKMVLSGEGADEIFGGYLYFHKAPSSAELHHETVRKLKDLHLYDCLRANKSTCAWGVEARVPFLDRDFLDVAMGMNPKQKMCRHPAGEDGSSGEPRMEKWTLRKAFDTPDDPYLPADVLWRQKEQFSDGVGYTWIDSLRDLAEREVSDTMFAQAAFLFPENTPPTKENYLYRSIFVSHFPQHSAQLTVPSGPSIACSSATAVKWCKEFEALVAGAAGDCSGRAVDVHASAYEDAVAVATGQEAKEKKAVAEPDAKKRKINA